MARKIVSKIRTESKRSRVKEERVKNYKNERNIRNEENEEYKK
jgi:hypothetical protein